MARYEEVKVRGYEEFRQAVSQRSGKDIFAYFTGDKDAQGQSWCPDCVKGKKIQKKKSGSLYCKSILLKQILFLTFYFAMLYARVCTPCL